MNRTSVAILLLLLSTASVFADEVSYFGNSLLHESQGNLDLAIDDMNHFIEANLSKPQQLTKAFGRRGSLYEAKGDKTSAIADYTKVLESDSNDKAAVNGLKRLGVRLMTNRKYGYGFEIYKEPEKIPVPTAEELATIAAFARVRGECNRLSGEAKLTACNKAIQDNPNDTQSLVNRASYLMENLRDAPGAMSDLARAIDVPAPKFVWDGGGVEGQWAIGPCRFYDRRQQGEMCTGDQLVDHNRFPVIRTEAYTLRSELFEKLGDLDHAIEDMTNAMKSELQWVSPVTDDRGAIDRRAALYEKKGDLKKAIADYSQSLEWNGADQQAVDALHRLGVKLVVSRSGWGLEVYKEPVFK
jgi:tetratricopeptide (TPR) repeat protein